MKKFLSIILALAMVACMSVTAFAADPTTTLTVEVPDNTPSYTFHCPASVTLEYGNTDKQEVGDFYVTDVVGTGFIKCTPQYTDLVNTADSTDTISLVLYDTCTEFPEPEYPRSELNKSGYQIPSYAVAALFMEDFSDWGGWTNPYNNHSLSAQVSDWSGATPGATYQATITYVVTAE